MAEKWAYVSDYIRAYAIYNYGSGYTSRIQMY